MADEIIDKITNTKRIGIRVTTTLDEIAKQYDCDPDILLKANPHISSSTEKIIYRYIYIPSIHSTSSQNQNQQSILGSQLQPVLSQLKNKLGVLLDDYYNFDKGAIDLKENMKKKMRDFYSSPEYISDVIYTHRKVFDDLFPDDEFKRDYFYSKYPGFKKYAENVSKNYKEAMKHMLFFFRNMFHLFYLIQFPHVFFKIEKAKIKDALIFANRFINVVLGRISYYLYYISHQYEKLNCTYTDLVYYQNITDICNSTFKELNKYFSKEGYMATILYLHDFDRFFKIDSVQRWLELNKINFPERHNKSVRDKYIFDYSIDYTAKKSEEEIKKIRDDLDEKVKKMVNEFYKDDEEEAKNIRFYHSGHYLIRIEETINESLERLKSCYDSIYSKMSFEEEMVLERLRYTTELLGCNCRSRIDRANRLLKTKTEFDKELEKAVSNVEAVYFAYLTCAGLFYMAAQVAEQINPVESFFVNEEDFYKYIESVMNGVFHLALKEDAGQLWEKIKELNQDARWKELTERATKLIETANTAGFILELVAVIIITVIVTVGFIYLGPLVAGFLTPIIGEAGAFFAVIFMEAVVFTIVPEAFSSWIEQRPFFNHSFAEFSYSFVTNFITILVFSQLGNALKGLNKVINNKALLVMTKTVINFTAGVLITSPFFIAQLVASGKHPFAWEEWLRFLCVQAVFSIVFAGFTSLEGRIEEIQKALFQKGYNAGATVKKLWDQGVQKIYITKIKTEINKIKPEIEKMQGESLIINEEGDFQSYDRKHYQEKARQATSIKDKLLNILKYFKEARKTLKDINRMIDKVKYGIVDADFSEELKTLEYLIKNAEHTVDRTSHYADMNFELGYNINQTTQKAGLVPIGKRSNLAFGDITEIIKAMDAIHDINFKGEMIRIVEFTSFTTHLQESAIVAQARVWYKGQLHLAQLTIIDNRGEVFIPPEKLDKRIDLPDQKTLPKVLDVLFEFLPWKTVFGIEVPSLSEIISYSNTLNDSFVSKVFNKSNKKLMENLEIAAGNRNLVEYTGKEGLIEIKDDFMKELLDILQDPKKTGFNGNLTIDNVTNILLVVLYAYDPYTAKTHSKNVASLVKGFAETMVDSYNELVKIPEKKRTSAQKESLKFYKKNLDAFSSKQLLSDARDINKSMLKRIELAALLHDIGKTVVPAEIINNPGRPSDDEFKKIQWHPEATGAILKKINQLVKNIFDIDIIKYALQHHVKDFANAGGYPYSYSDNYDRLDIIDAMMKASDIISALGDEGRTYRTSLEDFEKLIKILDEELKCIDRKTKEYPHPDKMTIGRELLAEIMKNSKFKALIKKHYPKMK